MRLIAQLSMPSNNSWNGKWTGDNRVYTKVFSASTSKKMKRFIGSYRYSFGDGWVACVTVREAKPRERVSNIFCGYEWMISSIKVHGEIKSSHD